MLNNSLRFNHLLHWYHFIQSKIYMKCENNMLMAANCCILKAQAAKLCFIQSGDSLAPIDTIKQPRQPREALLLPDIHLDALAKFNHVYRS